MGQSLYIGNSEPAIGGFGSPEHWKKRANESCAIADQIGDSDAKAKMLAVAESYGEIAARAEARMKQQNASLSTAPQGKDPPTETTEASAPP